MRAFAPRAFIVGLFFAIDAAAGVIVVDPQGQPGTPILQAAIDAAQSGDILLVRAGSYVASASAQRLKITAKGITLINDSTSTIWLPAMFIDSVPAGTAVVVRGFKISSSTSLAGYPQVGLWCFNSAGMIWIEECAVYGGGGQIHPHFGGLPSVPGMEASNAANVVLERTTIVGGNGGTQPPFGSLAGARGGHAVGSSLVLHDSSISGGYTPCLSVGPAGQSQGLVLATSTVFASGSTIIGGQDAGSFQFCSGLRIEDTLSQVWLRDSIVEHGALCGVHQTPGPAIDQIGDSVDVLPATTASIRIESPARTGDVVTLTIEGEAGANVAVLVGGFGTNFIVPTPYQNALLMDFNFAGPVLLGTIPALGTLSMNFLAFPLPASTPDGMTVALQCLMMSPHFTLEAATAYVQVKSGL